MRSNKQYIDRLNNSLQLPMLLNSVCAYFWNNLNLQKSCTKLYEDYAPPLNPPYLPRPHPKYFSVPFLESRVFSYIMKKQWLEPGYQQRYTTIHKLY